MTAEQIGLFGELDGLFAPELIPCTPPELVELIPGDHVAAMRGLEGSPATAERIRAYEADRAERLAEIAQEHDERYPVDEWDAHPCAEFDAGPDDEHLWCALCGWEEPDHHSVPCDDCGGPQWAGIDHDCPIPAITDAETAAADADPEQAWTNAFGPEPDDDDEAEHVDWTDRPEYRWSADRLPSLVDILGGIAPWIVCETIGADTDADAAKVLAARLSSSGRGDGRGYIEHDTRGAWLVDLEAHDRTLAASWTQVARELRAVATDDDYETMRTAISASAEIARAGQDDLRPWVPAYLFDKMSTAERFEHERADREHERRQRRRDEQQSPLDYTARTVQRDLESRLAGPRPGALF